MRPYSGTDYRGINYGRFDPTVNMDVTAGIRNGVIPANDVGQAWYEDSEMEFIYTCPECDVDVDMEEVSEIICPNCGYEFDDFDFDSTEPIGFYYIKEGYHLYQPQDDPDIFITKSPYFGYFQFCSPCAPGAVYLPSPLKNLDEFTDNGNNNMGYCLGPEWFEDEIPPYDVYSVQTGELICKAGEKRKEFKNG